MTIKLSFSRQSSRIFDEQAEDLNYEKRKTDGLLQQLLPVEIIAQLKVILVSDWLKQFLPLIGPGWRTTLAQAV